MLPFILRERLIKQLLEVIEKLQDSSNVETDGFFALIEICHRDAETVREIYLRAWQEGGCGKTEFSDIYPHDSSIESESDPLRMKKIRSMNKYLPLTQPSKQLLQKRYYQDYA